MALRSRRPDLTRTTFAVLFIGALLGGSLWILRPFLGPTIWATMVVVTTWPLMRRIETRLWGRRSLAVAVMTLILLLLFIVPLTLAIVTIVDNADRLVDWAHLAAGYRLPAAAPDWLVNLPLVGGLVQRAWLQATALGLQDLLPRLSPYAGDLTRWFASQVGSVSMLLLQFLMTVVIAAVLFGVGEDAADHVRRFARRLGGEQGVDAVTLAGGAIRGVALGVGITAVVQAVLAGLGLAAAGVPFAGLLTALSFMLCIAQVGVLPVLVPAALWLFWGDQTGWGIALAIWTLLVAAMDNVLRPLLIKMGADLPLMLIFAGVIGGLLAFGLVGIFVGPVVLAVAYTLLETWMGDIQVARAEPPSGDPS
ncbi:MAG: AI-2E family transporter YdiK [Leptothrix sp. (in: b-proteobacteria)]